MIMVEWRKGSTLKRDTRVQAQSFLAHLKFSETSFIYVFVGGAQVELSQSILPGYKISF